MALQYLKTAYNPTSRRQTDFLHSLVVIRQGGGGGIILKEGKFRLDVRKKFFTQRVVRHWKRLPRKVLDIPSLEAWMEPWAA